MASTMGGKFDNWIRSLKDNRTGKVVNDGGGNRWEWEPSDADNTTHLLKKLQNDELSLEQTNVAKPGGVDRSKPDPKAPPPARRDSDAPPSRTAPRGRDAGGGFNPYDSSGKPSRR
jgi:hypothetical protein